MNTGISNHRQQGIPKYIVKKIYLLQQEKVMQNGDLVTAEANNFWQITNKGSQDKQEQGEEVFTSTFTQELP